MVAWSIALISNCLLPSRPHWGKTHLVYARPENNLANGVVRQLEPSDPH